MANKTIIVSLITDDLINQKLINSFRDLGIDAEEYNLQLGSNVFQLMGIKRPVEDTFFNQYMRLAETSKHIPIHEGRKAFKVLALEIYDYLHSLRKKN
jgi:hypothetical protein